MNISNIAASDLTMIKGMPLLLQLEEGSVKTMDWVDEYHQNIERLIRDNGAVLIRGLNIYGSKQFAKVLEKIFGSPLLEYTYRSTPRTEMRGNVYTATEYPANEVIPQHNENSYSRNWPNRIGFLCLKPSETGGETPISDSRLIYKKLPLAVRQKFEEKGIMYVRNYSDLDLPWAEVFQTEDKQCVEDYCKKNDLSIDWLGDDGLRTKQVNKAVLKHSISGEKVWFNQAHLFNVSSLDQDIHNTLLTTLGESLLPRNTYYGDGSPIESEVLALIRDLYESTKIKFKWQKGDLLLLDNVLFTHGRESYTGTRKVLTGMACPNL